MQEQAGQLGHCRAAALGHCLVPTLPWLHIKREDIKILCASAAGSGAGFPGRQAASAQVHSHSKALGS